MIYELAHVIQRRFPYLWGLFESINSRLFSIRYRRRLSAIPDILKSYSRDFVLQEACINDTDSLVAFFKEQPDSSYSFFKPHSFDAKTIKKLICRRSFLFLIVKKEGKIVGYFFIRCFFTGKCFRGKIVHFRYQGQGIAKLMGKASMGIATALGMRMFGTISPENKASLASASAVNNVRLIRELPNGFLYVEYLPKI